jgi:hypothetical protein
MSPTIGMKIAPTKADAPHPDQRLARFRGWLGNMALSKFNRSLQNDLPHYVLSLEAVLA